MKISLIISLKSVLGFGYTSTKAVKEQILDCKEAAVLCNALCGNHDADHQAFQEINKDDAFDATVNVARQNGMYKNQEMCRICSKKTVNIEQFCLRKLYDNDFFWA